MLITESKFYETLNIYLDDDIQNKMKGNSQFINATTEWEVSTDQIVKLAMESARAKGFSLSTSRGKLLELKKLCACVLADEKLRYRIESLLSERENYLRLL